MRKEVIAGLLLALAISSSGSAQPVNLKPLAPNALERPYFAKVAQLSDGMVRPLKEEGYNYSQNMIFRVDLEGKGSSYISSYGRANLNIYAATAKADISYILQNDPRKFVRKGQLVILILNEKKGGKLTILPLHPKQEINVEIRPLRRKGKSRTIPYDAERCVNWIPRDRDAISWGDSGSVTLIYYKTGWKYLNCDDGQ